MGAIIEEHISEEEDDELEDKCAVADNPHLDEPAMFVLKSPRSAGYWNDPCVPFTCNPQFEAVAEKAQHLLLLQLFLGFVPVDSFAFYFGEMESQMRE
ncbi:hypothetical protein BBJ28_00022681, partial [Nothophytophthora sp. Chile5]